MKKILIFSMILPALLCSCGKAEPAQAEQKDDAPVVQVIPEPSEYEDCEMERQLKEVAINNATETVREVVDEYLIADRYDEENDVYFAMITVDGIKDAYESDEFYDLCDVLDDITESVHNKYGIDTIILLVSDKAHDECLYASKNGDNLTSVFQ